MQARLPAFIQHRAFGRLSRGRPMAFMERFKLNASAVGSQ